MFHHKGAVMMAVAGLLASAGFAMGESTQVQTPALTLDPVAAAPAPAAPAAEAAAPDGLLMQGLGKLGMEKTLQDYGLNIYGWIEGGYTYSHRHHESNIGGLVLPGPFNHEYHNHMMLNQFDLRFEKQIDGKKFDVGGMVEVLYGTDAARIHSTGLGYNGSDPTDNNRPFDPEAVANLDPSLQFDIPQAYVDVGVPVGNGLVLRVGKFVSLLSIETIDPRGNAFYSHSYLFSMVNFTNTGVLAMYKINDNWSVKAGISRGWDIALEDNNGCAIDTIGQLIWQNAATNPTLTAQMNWSVGPENASDESHYRTVIDPIVSWKATEQLTISGEALYVYDGGRNGDAAIGDSHAYGDTWGLALYGAYKINDMVTANVRVEKAHFFINSIDGLNIGSSALSSSGGSSGGIPTSGIPTGIPTGGIGSGSGSGLGLGAFPQTNFYEITLGATVTPFPKDPIGKNLSIRPEIRYDYCEDHVFGNGAGHFFKDQLTFGADVIVTF